MWDNVSSQVMAAEARTRALAETRQHEGSVTMSASRAARQTSEPANGQQELTREDRQRVADVAELYYVRGLNVHAVGTQLNLSRSTVSRALAKARQHGVVEFSVRRQADPTSGLSSMLAERFGVRAVVVDSRDVSDENGRLDLVAERAAQQLAAVVRSDMTVTVAWGTTVEAVARHLVVSPTRGTRVVQLNGSGNTVTSGIAYASRLLERFAYAFGASEHPFPVPAFFDSESTRAAMWQERSIQRILALRRSADVVVTSVGSLDSEIPGHLYRSGYLDAVDLEELRRRGVVGDIGSVFIRADGSSNEIPLNARTTGMPLDELRAVPTRLLIVSGQRKSVAVAAALRAGAATDLVLDDVTAATVLAN